MYLKKYLGKMFDDILTSKYYQVSNSEVHATRHRNEIKNDSETGGGYIPLAVK